MDERGSLSLSLSLFLSKAYLCRVASAIRSAFLKAKFEREQAAAASKAPEHKAGIWEGRNILGRLKYAIRIRPLLSSTRRMKKHHESTRGQVKMKGAFRDLADADQKLETWPYCSWFVQDVQATVGYVTPRDHEADYGFGGHGMNMASQDCYHNSKSSILIGFSIIKPSVRPPRPWARTGLPPPSPAPHPPSRTSWRVPLALPPAASPCARHRSNASPKRERRETRQTQNQKRSGGKKEIKIEK